MQSLVVLLTRHVEHDSDLLSGWSDVGASWVTMLDGVSAAKVLEKLARDDMPLMLSLRDILAAEEVPIKAILALVEGDERVNALAAVAREVLDSHPKNDRGIMFVVPLARVIDLAEV